MAYRDQIKCLCLAALLIASGSINAHGAESPIASVQGADHRTPLPFDTEVTITGVVTGHFGRGFFVQSPQPDSDAATSEGIFVFPGNSSTFAVPKRGDTVRVTGKPDEFQPFPVPPIMRTRKVAVCGTTEINEVQSDDRKSFLRITQLNSVTAVEVTGSAQLPAPAEFNPPGATTDISFADVPNTPFNPAKHPRDYFEALEGMRVIIRDAIAVSRKEPRWETFWVASQASLDASEKSAYGLPLTKAGHVFPEVFEVHRAKDQPPFAPTVGTPLGDLTGIMSYQNGVYMVILDDIIDAASLPQPAHVELPAPTFGEGVRIATYNAENMSVASQGAALKIKRMADQIVTDLNSPTVIGLQEVQDDDGEGATATTTAQLTIEALVQAISSAGGPLYKAIALDPVLPNTDGGAPGGNIRNVFLIRNDAGLSIKSSERLFDTADRCDRDANPFSSTRKPVLVEVEIGGKPFVFVNLHLSSKLGDDGLYTNAEDPKPGSTAGRKRQAERLVSELERRYGANPPAIILMGDFNDHADSEALEPIRDSNLRFDFKPDRRGESFTASYAFNGVREAIDHFVIGGAQIEASATYLNLNADALDQVSDHNPVILEIDTTR